MTLAFTLFVAGLLTILLPCILPLIPIVLGVSVTGRSKLRPLLTVAGMLVSFVGFTFVIQTFLANFIDAADILRISTFYVLLLFGVGFFTENKTTRTLVTVLGAFFFWWKGPVVVVCAAALGLVAMDIGGRIATRIQQLGADLQTGARSRFGAESPVTALLIGLTLGLVWVPCAGPALSLALTLVRDEPGPRAAFLLFCYGLGTAVPLLLIGYGGQAAVHSVRAIAPYTGVIKKISGVLLMLTAVALQFVLFERLQIWLVEHTSFGDIGTRIEERLFGDDMPESMFDGMSSSSQAEGLHLPKISRAPELNSSGPWHNTPPSGLRVAGNSSASDLRVAGNSSASDLRVAGSNPALTLADLKGKVVLVDFWTYSCINCIRTLPYIQGYWDKYKATDKFVIIGVHTPEFVFEKSSQNVADAIKRHGLTYPTVQDNDYGTWNAFANHYWPAKYLIDANGYIRYTHFGEGDYDKTDKAIASLLGEIGVTVDIQQSAVSSEATGGYRSQSPETYLGERSWPALFNSEGEPTDQVVSYKAPESLPLNKYALVGDWMLMDGERQVLQSDTGEIRMHWQGGEINLVLGPGASTGGVTGDVFIDGEKMKTITVDRYDLYNLYKGAYGDHQLVLKLKGKGVQGYAFTFGN